MKPMTDYEQLAADIDAKHAREREHQRLKDAVVDAAKENRLATFSDYRIETHQALHRAVDALLDFQEQQK